MSKRVKFIVTSTILSLGFIGIQIIENDFRFYAIGGLSVLTILLFTWSLSEGLGKDATLVSLILPPLFTFGVGIFWFLLPATIFAKLPIVILYGVGIYALSLTSNIFTVAAIRTIALSRAAKGVGFVLTLLTSFLIYDAVLSIRGEIWFNTILVVLTSFPLILQGLWSSLLEKKFSFNLILYTIIMSLGMGQIAALLYFWPVSVVVGSLFLTIGVYTMLGLGQMRLEGRLFAQNVKEYLVVGLIVFIGMFLVTSWGG